MSADHPTSLYKRRKVGTRIKRSVLIRSSRMIAFVPTSSLTRHHRLYREAPPLGGGRILTRTCSFGVCGRARPTPLARSGKDRIRGLRKPQCYRSLLRDWQYGSLVHVSPVQGKKRRTGIYSTMVEQSAHFHLRCASVAPPRGQEKKSSCVCLQRRSQEGRKSIFAVVHQTQPTMSVFSSP